MADATNPPAEKAPEFSGDFDAERATTLVTNLRAEVADVKGKLAAVTTERDEFKTAAETTGTEREAALQAALDRANTAELKLALKDSGLAEDVVTEFADYLTGTPAEVAAKAAKLAARLTPKVETDETDDDDADDDAPDETPDDAPVVKARPEPRLTPGHGGTPPASFDPVAMAREIRGG